MEIMTRLTNKEFSQKKLEEYSNWQKIVQCGRQNPIWFWNGHLVLNLWTSRNGCT